MVEWWVGLALAFKFYYAIAIATSLFLALQLIGLLLGIGDGDLDVDTDLDADGGSGVLSVRTVTAFLAGFGWTGALALEYGQPVPLATLLAVLVGGAFMALVVVLMRGLYGLRQTGTLDYANAVGQIGSVYLRVPPSMAGPGQVEVTVQGRLRVVQAFNRSGRELPNGSRVRVVDTMDQNTIVVEPLEPPKDQNKAPDTAAQES